MRIGVARPSEEELNAVPHHLMGHRSIHQPYTAADYAREAREALQHVVAKTGTAVVVGGSGLYLLAALEGLDEVPPTPPEVRAHWEDVFAAEGLQGLQRRVAERDPDYWATVDQKNPRRLLRALEVMEQTGSTYSELRRGRAGDRPFAVAYHRLVPDRTALRQRIERRVVAMAEAGLVEEVRSLEPFRDLPALQTVGYREFYQTWDAGGSDQTALDLVALRTSQYARRQETWLNKYVGSAPTR
jgi:tRNA dimethylallyltransferase